MNAFHEGLGFSLPPDEMGRRWEVVFDTARDGAAGEIYAAASEYSPGAALGRRPDSARCAAGWRHVRRWSAPPETEPSPEGPAAATPPEPTT